MAGVGQKYGISGSLGAGWTFAGNLNMPAGTLNNESALTGITAGTTRTQAGAVALVNEISRVDTSTAPAAGATLGDGVRLPAAAAGLDLVVWNNTANNIQVYGAGSDTVNGVAGATGVILPPSGVYLFMAAGPGAWACDGVGAGASGNFPTVTALVGLTAFAGGGQGSATAIPTQMARFDTVATAGDSSKLPAGKAGMQITVANNGAAAMNVFPASGEQVNAAGANVAFALPNGKTASFNCMANGAWHAVLSA